MKQKATKGSVQVADLAKKKGPLSAKEARGVVGGMGGNIIGAIGDEFAGTVAPTVVKGKR
jgi:hypothetical protein